MSFLLKWFIPFGSMMNGGESIRGVPWMDETSVLLEKLQATAQARQRNYLKEPSLSEFLPLVGN